MTTQDPPPVFQFTRINGQPEQAISVADRGFAYGDGLFETMLYENGDVPLLAHHLARMVSSAARMGITLDESTVRTEVGAIVTDLRNHAITTARIKLTATRGQGGQASYPAFDLKPTLVVDAQRHTPENEPTAVAAITSPVLLPNIAMLAGIKHLNRLPYILGAQCAGRNNGQEVFFLDQQHRLIESMHHNIFFVQGDQLVTPVLAQCGVRGIMRSLVIEQLAKAIGMTAQEKILTVGDAQVSQAVFLCNALQGFVPVSDIDGMAVPQNDVWQKLQASLGQLKNISSNIP